MSQVTGRVDPKRTVGLRGWIASDQASTFIAVLAGVLVLGQGALTKLTQLNALPASLPSYVAPTVLLALGAGMGLFLSNRTR